MSNRTLAMISQDRRLPVQAHQPPIPIIASVNGHAQAVVVIVGSVGEHRGSVMPHAVVRERAVIAEAGPSDTQWAA